jgi:putative aldouronate transport system permease protein
VRLRATVPSKAFHVINYIILSCLSATTIYPLLNLVSVSLSSYKAYVLNPMMVLPRELTLSAYAKIMSYPTFGSSYRITVIVTVVGTAVNMLLTTILAYPLSKKRLKGTGLILGLIVFSMIFRPTLIPLFLVVRNLGLLDTIWALILPSAILAFDLILMKNFFQSIPESMEESAFIDGATEWQVLFRILIPLAKPAIATLSLFYAVFHWNDYFSGVIYMRSVAKWPLQLLLREIVMQANFGTLMGGMFEQADLADVMPFPVQMATVVVAVVPMLVVYPFLQKYFVKGTLLGAVKG